MSQPRSGHRYGKWLLVDRLGRGGNADVWRARDNAGNEVAIKVLRQKNPSSEPFRRFQQEVATVQQLTEEGFAGVLPILDAHLPSATGRPGRAWFAAPVVTPISEALGPTAELDDVVTAVMVIADTLARLAERGLAHRDVKPENIYQFDGKWVIGDFGLVKIPGSALTADAVKLGPQHYIAPEMLNNPSRAQGPPADVYSLAKTFWVLASGQRFPLQGQHDVKTPATTVSAYVHHPRAAVLDVMLQEATAFEPSRRPTAATIKADLSEWLRSGDSTPGQENLSLIKQRLKIATSHVGEIQDREDRQQWLFTQLSTRLLDHLNRVPEITSATGFPPPRRFDHPDNFSNFSPGWAFYAGKEIRDPRSRVGDKAVYLEIGAGVKYRDHDTVEIKAAHTLLEGRKTFRLPDFPRGWDIYRSESVWTKRVSGQLDNTRHLLTCEQICEQFLKELPKALGALTDRILMISEHIATGDTWDRYLNKLPTQPKTEPFIQFSWHPSRKRRRKD